MRNLERRIKKLEGSITIRPDDLEAISQEVLENMGTYKLVELAGSFGAEKRGEPLTEAQVSARRAYLESLERHCPAVRFDRSLAFSRPPNLKSALCLRICDPLCSSEFDLLCSASRAVHEEGRKLTEKESVVAERSRAEFARLCQLAGFSSVEEFDACIRPEYYPEWRR